MEEVYKSRGKSASGGELCVVVYRRPGTETTPPKDEPIFLIAHSQKPAQLSLFLNSVWREFVPEEDTEYIESLIEDLPERARIDPEGLFRHLSSLHVGSLITAEARSVSFREDALPHVPAEFTRLS